MKRKLTSILAFVLSLVLLLSFVSCNISTGDNGSTAASTTQGSATAGTTAGTTAASSIVKIDFYSINDLHGTVKDTDENSGIGKITTFLNSKAERQNAIFVSAGDMWQGGVESNNTKGKIVTDWMNQMGFSAMALGNHEFDWGTDKIKTNVELAEFPILAINVYERDTNERASWCQPSVMVEKEGIKIGIIGAVGDVYSSITSSRVKDVYFKVDNELTALVKEESTKLREEGADFILYLLHDGYSTRTTNTSTPVADSKLGHYDTSLSDGYVDLVFEGHTHTQNMYIDKYGVYHLQGGGYNDRISHVQVTFDKDKDDFRITTNELIDTRTLLYFEMDANALALYDKYADEIGNAYGTLGYNAQKRNSTYMSQLVADLYLQAGLEKWGDEYDIVLGGGKINCRSPYNLYQGDVCYADLMSLFPFDNNIVLCSIKGYYLKSRYLKNDSYYISLSDFGIENKDNIDDNATYYVIVDSYGVDYTWNNLTVVDVLDPDGIYAVDLLAKYAENGGFEN